ncbi:hypothetical protein pb186bvf_020860 [Paramecium bursaria]
MMNPIIDAKRSKFRQEIRKADLREFYKKKRIISVIDPTQEFFQLKLKFDEQIELEGIKIISNDLLMTQLLNSDSKSAYNILSNLCSMESNEYMDILVQRYQIHIYFLLNIDTQDYNDKTITMLSGIANLLYSSNTLLKKAVLYLLENKIFEQFIKLSHLANEAPSEQKVYLLRACLGMLLVVDQFELQHQVGYDGYTQILKLSLDWILVDTDLCCILIQKCSKYIKNIIRFTSLDILHYLLIQVIFTYNKKTKKIELIIDTFNKFIEGGDIDLIVELLDRQNVQDDIMRLCDQKYHKIHKNMMEFFQILADMDSEIINNYCIEMLPTMTEMFDESNNPQVWIKYGKLIHNLEIDDNSNYIYALIDRLMEENHSLHSSVKTKMLEIIDKLVGDRVLSITKEQHYYFEQLTMTLDDILERTVVMLLTKIVEI